MSSRPSRLSRTLLAMAATALVPLGWYWTGHPDRSCSATDGRTLDWIGAIMIAAAVATVVSALRGRRLLAGGLVLAVGWLAFLIGSGIALSCLS